MCIFATMAAFKVKHKLKEEDCDNPVEECKTSNGETNLTETYLKLPDQLTITKGTNRKLSRLSSIAKSTQMKDSQDTTAMLTLIVNHKNAKSLSVPEILYHDF